MEKGEVVQQQLPSATSHFVYRQSKKGRRLHRQNGSVDDFFMYNAYYTLCTLIEHSCPSSRVRETREGCVRL